MAVSWGHGLNFFSSSVADVALRLGPYMRVSRNLIVQGQRVLEVGKSIKATKPKTTKNKNDDSQIPQPDLRFASGNSEATAENKAKPTKKTGPEPKQKHPSNRFAIGRSGMTTASLSKTCNMNYGSQLSRQT